MGVIYKITSPSKKIYIGKTYDLRKRINCYKCASKKGSSIILLNSIRKYGWDAHVLEVVEEISDELLNEREVFWIKELGTYCYENPMGLNMTKGGDGQRSTWMHKTELRQWYSDKFTGEGNPFYGKQHNKETKTKMSELAKIRNKKDGRKIPEWGVENGRLKVIRAVICYDKYGNFLRDFYSITDAANKLNISKGGITESCKETSSGVDGKYIFRYKAPNFPLKIEVGVIKNKTVKRVVLYLSKDLNVIKEYDSSLEASIDLGIPKTTINRASMYNKLKPIRTGHIFIYKDLLEQQLKNKAAS